MILTFQREKIDFKKYKKYEKKCTNATLLSIHPPFSHQLSGNPLKYYFFPSPLKKFFKTFLPVSSDNIVRICEDVTEFI